MAKILAGAPDRRRYERFTAPTRAEAEAQARAFSLHVAVAGLVPVADRWDETSNVLAVVYAPAVPESGRQRPGSALRRAAAVLAAIVLVGGLVALAALAPDERRAAAPAATTTAGTRTSPPPNAHAGGLPHFEPTECRTDWQFGRRTECGDLTVLEDRADPDGALVALHVAIHRSHSRNSRPDPVVYLEGGPGGAPLVDGFWAYPFIEERDVIVFDQRGTGLALPSLDCHEVTSLVLLNELEALRRCRQRLEAEGIRLSAYNSAHSAADLEDLRLALGYEEWNLYGISYGTRLALTSLRDHASGLRSLVLDSVYPPHVDFYLETPGNAQRAFDTLFAACAADELCQEAYPDLGERFYALVERLDRSPISVGGGVLGLGSFSVDGSLLLQYLFHNMYVTEYLADLPAELEDFLAGEWSGLDFWYSILESAYWTSESEGFHYSVQCSEELPFSDPAGLAGQPAVRAMLDITFGAQYMREVCEMWDVPPADARENLPVVSDVPVLLLAGAYDPVTPPAWAESAAQYLSAAQVVVVPDVGHGVLGSSFCIDDIVLSFLDEPLVAVDEHCLEELDELIFTLPR